MCGIITPMKIISLSLLSILLFLGCGPAPDTRCGQRLNKERPSWLTVEDIQIAEDALLTEIPNLADPRINNPDVACAWLDGLIVTAMPNPTFIDDWGRTVSGIAFPGVDLWLDKHISGGSIAVGNYGTWQKSALIHEYLHIMQGTVGAPPCRRGDDPHCGWYLPKGPYEIIELVNKH